MKKSHTNFLLFLFLGILASFITTSYADQSTTTANTKSDSKTSAIPEYAKVYSTNSTFFDAKSDLLEAITNSGLVISYISHAKDMLANTAAVSGVTKAVYTDAEIYLF